MSVSLSTISEVRYVGIALNPLPAYRLELFTKRALDVVVFLLDFAHTITSALMELLDWAFNPKILTKRFTQPPPRHWQIILMI